MRVLAIIGISKIRFFIKLEAIKNSYWSLDVTYQKLLNYFDVCPIRFAPENFKFCMGFAKNLLNEIERSINSVD
jgi:hypothetical protein